MSQLLEEQIRPRDLMRDKQHCVDADREFLLARGYAWEESPCPACGACRHSPFGEKRGFAYVICDECATVFTNPRPSLSLLHEFYATSRNYAYWNEHIFPATEAVRRERIFRPRARRVAELCRRFGVAGGTLVEIGAAFGTFCEAMREEELFERIVAVEPTPGLAETCRERGFEVEECFVEQIAWEREANVVAAFEVIEHLHAPREFIAACRRLLRPGGILVVSCPNVRGFDAATLGVEAGMFDHEHLNYFHPESLAQLVESEGFRVLELSTPGELDADLVRKQVLAGRLDLQGQPLLRTVLVDRWSELGEPFQKFLAANGLSSHLWIVCQSRADN